MVGPTLKPKPIPSFLPILKPRCMAIASDTSGMLGAAGSIRRRINSPFNRTSMIPSPVTTRSRGAGAAPTSSRAMVAVIVRRVTAIPLR